jgi:hypothetical protein
MDSNIDMPLAERSWGVKTMSISAVEVAKLTGLSKQAVINAINLGKISAVDCQ